MTENPNGISFDQCHFEAKQSAVHFVGNRGATFVNVHLSGDAVESRGGADGPLHPMSDTDRDNLIHNIGQDQAWRDAHAALADDDATWLGEDPPPDFEILRDVLQEVGLDSTWADIAARAVWTAGYRQPEATDWVNG